MAYRRRQGMSRASTLKEDFEFHHDGNASHPSSSSSSSSLAAQAIKASPPSRYHPSLSFAFQDHDPQRSKSFDAYGGEGRDGSKSGFWSVLSQKAKSSSFNTNTFTPSVADQPLYQPPDSNKKMDNPTFRKGLDAITSSLNQLGDTFEKAFEEGRTMVESKTADLGTQIRRKGNVTVDSNQASAVRNPWQQSAQTQAPSSQETQLKASREVAMATAAKAKLLLRELKTVKADLAFAKARCAQLEEEEEKLLRDRKGSDKGHDREHDDDDLIRLQLETLVAEKARLASENEIYSRENRFLREIVEYHQLTMQDVVYLDEGMEEVTHVYPIDSSGVSSTPPSPDEVPSMLTKDIFPVAEEDN